MHKRICKSEKESLYLVTIKVHQVTLKVDDRLLVLTTNNVQAPHLRLTRSTDIDGEKKSDILPLRLIQILRK